MAKLFDFSRALEDKLDGQTFANIRGETVSLPIQAMGKTVFSLGHVEGMMRVLGHFGLPEERDDLAELREECLAKGVNVVDLKDDWRRGNLMRRYHPDLIANSMAANAKR